MLQLIYHKGLGLKDPWINIDFLVIATSGYYFSFVGG